MLDRRFVADNIDLVTDNCRKRGSDADVARFAELDRLRRQFQADIDRINQQAGQVSKSIGKAADAERESLKAEGRRLREEVAALETKQAEIVAESDAILRAIPNLTHPASPTGGEDAAVALREMLRLHDLRDTPESRAAIAGLVSVQSGPGIARIPGQRPGVFVRGLDVTLTFEPQAWTGGGLYLLGAVLERFLALQVSVNGFVRTRAMLRGRSAPVASWAPRSGTRVLL